MTFQFRTDLTVRTPAPDLLRYIDQLEQRVAMSEELDAAQATARLQLAFNLTPAMAAILAALADGRVHNKEHLLAVACSNRPDDPPEMKIVDVWVCKIRKRLHGTGIVIDTVWGTGYRVADTTLLKRAMAGEAIERTHPVDVAPIGKPKGAKPTAGFGAVTSAAWKALHAMAKDGVVECTSAELSRATGGKTPGCILVRRFEEHGLLEVVRKSVRGSGWVLRLK